MGSKTALPRNCVSRERERERQRETKRETETDTHTQTHTDTHTHTPTHTTHTRLHTPTDMGGGLENSIAAVFDLKTERERETHTQT